VRSRLNRQELVERATDAADRRRSALRLTRRGQATHDAIVPLARGVEAQLLAGLPAADLARLDRLLAALIARASALDGAGSARFLRTRRGGLVPWPRARPYISGEVRKSAPLFAVDAIRDAVVASDAAAPHPRAWPAAARSARSCVHHLSRVVLVDRVRARASASRQRRCSPRSAGVAHEGVAERDASIHQDDAAEVMDA